MKGIIEYKAPEYKEPSRETSLSESIRSAVNSVSRENVSNTPDFVLTEYLLKSLEAVEALVNSRDRWYGIKPRPGQVSADELINEIFESCACVGQSMSYLIPSLYRKVQNYIEIRDNKPITLER